MWSNQNKINRNATPRFFSGWSKKILTIRRIFIFQNYFQFAANLGTGLGLSLSYDIAISHGSEIKAETNEGEGAEFIILLPV